MSKGAKLVVGGGKVKIGVHPGSYDLCIRPTRFCIYDDSSVIFRGSCNISRGTNVIVRYGGEMIIGDNFFCNANCNLLCNKKVEFEDDVLFGWNVTVLDSDGHTTLIGNEERICTKPILIGRHSWLSANTTVLKGVSLAEDTIVPYGMVVYKSNTEREVVFANKVLKSNIRRNE